MSSTVWSEGAECDSLEAQQDPESSGGKGKWLLAGDEDAHSITQVNLIYVLSKTRNIYKEHFGDKWSNVNMDIKGNRVKMFKQYDFEIEIIQGNVLDLQRHSLSILG